MFIEFDLHMNPLHAARLVIKDRLNEAELKLNHQQWTIEPPAGEDDQQASWRQVWGLRCGEIMKNSVEKHGPGTNTKHESKGEALGQSISLN